MSNCLLFKVVSGSENIISGYIIMAFERDHSLIALTTVTDCFSLVLRGAGVLHVWGGRQARWDVLFSTDRK